MPRYGVVAARKIRGDDETWAEIYDENRPWSITVYEDETEFERIGVLDAQGRELVRIRRRRPIGFLADIEEE